MSPTEYESEEESRLGSSKTSAASVTFRDAILKKGYHGTFSSTNLTHSQLPQGVADTTCEHSKKQTEARLTFELLQGQGPGDGDVIRLGKTLSKAAGGDDLLVEEDWKRQVWIPYYNALVEIHPSLRSMGNVFWWKDGYPQSRNPRKEFQAPKADVAIGFRVLEQDTPFHSDILLTLQEAPHLCLRPCPGPPEDRNAVAYPTFVHEIKPGEGSQTLVENQLSRSLVWLLHQQDELRKAALDLDPAANNVELPIFGVTSVGDEVKLFSATGTSSTGFQIVREGIPLDLLHPAGACAFAAFCLSALQWSKDVYKPQIAQWIAVVYAHTQRTRQEAISRYARGTSGMPEHFEAQEACQS